MYHPTVSSKNILYMSRTYNDNLVDTIKCKCINCIQIYLPKCLKHYLLDCYIILYVIIYYIITCCQTIGHFNLYLNLLALSIMSNYHSHLLPLTDSFTSEYVYFMCLNVTLSSFPLLNTFQRTTCLFYLFGPCLFLPALPILYIYLHHCAKRVKL